MGQLGISSALTSHAVGRPASPDAPSGCWAAPHHLRGEPEPLRSPVVPPSARANACVCALSTPRCHAFPGARLLLPALALAAPIEAILHANNARDADEDKRNGIRTLAQMLGPRASFNFYAALLAVPMAYSAVQAWRRSVLGALPLLAAPLARKLVTAFRTGDFVDLPKKTTKFQVEGWVGGGNK